MSTRILVPSGVLGLGFDLGALNRGVSRSPDAICIDGGSTDSGPFYLGEGVTKYAESATRSQWKDLLIARENAKVPLIIGTAGTCGVDAMVDWMAKLTDELLQELGLKAQVARIYSEQSPDAVTSALATGQIEPLEAAPTVSESTIASCSHIVALAGVEPIQTALNNHADIVIAGRTTDTAVIAAVPLMRGEHAGASWHAAKIAECGALCSTHPTSGVIEVDIDSVGFTVRALAEGASCTPRSVAAHMLYENSDPIHLLEPGGTLDVSDAQYTIEDEREGSIRVEGSRWMPNSNYTVKLEGARLAGYQSTVLAVLRNAHYVENAKRWVARLSDFLDADIQQRMQLVANKDYTLEFRLIGVDSVLGEIEHRTALPVEVGVLALVTANTEHHADDIARLINPFVLHYPLTDDEELPTFAFPYSPAQSNRGAFYEFALNHIMTLSSPEAAFRVEYGALGVRANANTNTNANASASSSAGANANASASSNANAGAGVSSGAGTNTDSSARAITDANASTNADVKTGKGCDASRDTVQINQQNQSLASQSSVTNTQSQSQSQSQPLRDAVQKVRSKNAGPFWVTVDVFCLDAQQYENVCTALKTADVESCFKLSPGALKRFDLTDLWVIKFSFPRTVVQGDRYDRDMHGAQYAERLAELEIGELVT